MDTTHDQIKRQVHGVEMPGVSHGFQWRQFLLPPLAPELQERFRRYFHQDALEHTLLALLFGFIASILVYVVLGLLAQDGGWLQGPQLSRALRCILIGGVLLTVCLNWNLFNRYWLPITMGALVLAYVVIPVASVTVNQGSDIALGWPTAVTQVLVVVLTYSFLRLPLRTITLFAVPSNIFVTWVLYQYSPTEGALAGGLLTAITLVGIASWFNVYRRERQLFAQVLRLEAAANQEQEVRFNMMQMADKQARLRRAIAHDIRQPMAAVAIQMALLKDRGSDSRESLENLSTALEGLRLQVDAIASTDESVSEETDASTTTTQPEPELVYASSLISSAASLNRPLATRQGHEIRLWISERARTALVFTIPGKLTVVLQSLMSNALKAVNGRPNSGIFLGMNVIRDELRIRVLDTGQGIAASDYPEIFKEGFSRFKERTDTATESRGLGLYNVARMLEEMPGHSISVQSKLGKYTSFMLRISRTSPIPHHVNTDAVFVRNPPELSESPFEGRHVLLVEDNKVLLSSMRELFVAWGATVTVASSVEECRQAVKDFELAFDIIVSDFNLGEPFDGLQLVREISEYYDGSVATVVINGEDVRFPQDLDIPVLYKPFSPTYLKTLLTEQMEQVAARLN